MSDDTRRIPPRSSDQSDGPTGQIRGMSGPVLEVAGLTDKGRVRPGNEDNLIYEEPTSAQAQAQGTLLVVSDGMGGHAAGEVASQIAVETIREAFYRSHGRPIADALRDAIVTANTAIHEAAQRDRERAGMGCTIVALVVQGADLTIGHVGDSRAYLIRGGQAIPLTQDHSWVAMQVAEGILTPEQAEHHPNRSVLMRALGRQPSVEVEVSRQQLQPGDLLLLCSDGLTGMVTDAEIADIASRTPPQVLPKQLVDLANLRGAPDNVTVLVGAVSGTPGSAQTVSGSATTMIAPALDARTPRLEQTGGDSPTDRNIQRPSSPTVPLGTPVRPTGGAPAGTPIVVARSSVTQADGLGAARPRGKGKWIAGAIAAFGLAAALLLLSVSQLSRDNSAPAPSATGTPVPAVGTAAVASPVATIPPPISTVLPLLPVGPPSQAAPAAPAVAPSATATRPAAAASPAATPTRDISSLIPSIPTLQGIFATPTPTASPEGGSSRTPPTSSETPPTGPGGGAPPESAPQEPAPADQPPPEQQPGGDPPPQGNSPQEKPRFEVPGGFSLPPARKRDDE